MAKKIKIKREVKIGFFSVLMLLALYWAINFIKGTDLFRGTETYIATYDHVNGLQASSSIMVNGFKVGVIRKMTFDPEKSEDVVLELSIQSKYRIPTDSHVRMFSDGLMGGKALQIELGSATTYLKKGDTISSITDKDFLEVAGSEFEYIKKKANTLVNSLTSTLQALDTLVRSNSGYITSTMSNISQISYSLKDVVAVEAADMKGTIKNLNALSQTLKDNGPRFDHIVSNLDTFSTYLASQKIPEAVGKLSESLSELNTAIDHINKGDGTAGKLVTDKALYDNLTEASSNLSTLLEDMKANPGRYVHFSLFGGGK